jgi:anthranilate synthase/aminodeoxychorismate synthase-like glutamine amidotransferase
MILVIDNHDSFTYNLVQLLLVQGAEVEVRRNDAVSAEEAEAMSPEGILVSPGPCGPREAGSAPDIVRRLGGSVPILGVCLGHQIIADVFGARVERAPVPVHGKSARVEHDGRGVFANLPSPFSAVRYHSLCVVEESLPAELEVTARSEDGVIQGLRHRTLPLHGVQFHPESILSEAGETLVGNFLREATHPTTGWRARGAAGGAR